MNNTIKVYAKTIAAFVVTVLGNALVNLINGGAPWPQTGGQWLQYAITSVGAALAVYGTPNQITQKQIDRSPNVIGAVVVPEIAKQASKAAQDAVVHATKDIPVAGDVVKDVTDQVGSVVDQVIRDFQNRSRA